MLSCLVLERGNTPNKQQKAKIWKVNYHLLAIDNVSVLNYTKSSADINLGGEREEDREEGTDLNVLLQLYNQIPKTCLS